jgi:tripartite-type tricarboxylate transporter receptor subunit TctC
MTASRAGLRSLARVAVAGLAAVLAGGSLAQEPANYPSGPVKMIVPFAPGGPTDVVARLLTDPLSARWGGKPIVIENRPGAGTLIGSNAIAKSAPDGYTLGMIVNSFMTNAATAKNPPFDANKDFSAVAVVSTQPMALVATMSFPANTVAALIAYAKRSPTPLNYTSPGPRGTGHFAGEMLKLRAAINMQHINYNGSAPALTDLIAGRVQLMFDVWHSAKPHAEAGELKLIAPIGADRLKDAPNVPTLAETYPGFDVSAMIAVVGPAGIPRLLVDKIAADIRAVVASAEFAEKSEHLGLERTYMTPDELDGWIKKEIVRWREIAASANMQIE